MIIGIFVECSKEGWGSPLAEWNGFDEDGGFQNSPLGVESRGKDSYSMIAGVEVAEKKSKIYKDDKLKREIQQPFSGNGVRKFVEYLIDSK